MSHLLFPIETISRELDIRLVMGAKLSGPGRRIYIGDKRIVHSIGGHLDGGVYLGKFVFHRVMNGDRHHYGRLKSRGFRLIYLDEEGGLWQGDENEWRRILPTKLDPSLFTTDELFLTWGGFQKAFYMSEYPSASEYEFVSTGHPRFDLSRPKWHDYFAKEVDRLKNRFGKFVLLNTNLDQANHVNGYKGSFSREMGYRRNDGTINTAFVPFWELKMQVLASFVVLIHRLSVLAPDQKIVVRPHPNENLNFYRYALAGLRNVEVIHEGGVIPWLLACDALIHDGCTTAIEGYLAQRRIINYRAMGPAPYEHLLANSIGLRCRTPEEVAAVLRGEAGGEQLADDHGRLKKMLENFNANSIVKVVTILDRELQHAEGGKPLAHMNLYWRMIGRKAEDRVKLLSGRRSAKLKDQAQKFPGFDRHYIQSRMAFLERKLSKPLPYHLFGDRLLVIG